MDGHNLKAECKVKTTAHHHSKTTIHSQTTLYISDCKLQTNATGRLIMLGTDFYRMSESGREVAFSQNEE
jgi:hypothetical protein